MAIKLQNLKFGIGRPKIMNGPIWVHGKSDPCSTSPPMN